MSKADKPRIAVNVGARRTLEYVVDAIGLLNRGVETVTIRGLGQSTTKAATVIRILADRFGAQVKESRVTMLTRQHTHFSGFETDIAMPGARNGDDRRIPRSENGHLEFPVYHLLIDALLCSHGTIKVCVDNEYPDAKMSEAAADDGNQSQPPKMELLTISKTDSAFQCAPGAGLKQVLGGGRKSGQGHQQSRALEHVTDAFCRSGMILSRHWETLSHELSKFDDLIIGVDTNILRDCVLTQQLLDGFTFIGGRNQVCTPNWLLLIVPHGVMHEIEQIANARDNAGRLNRSGRLGFRALGEILELDQSSDVLGTSILIVGDADPILDARVEIRGLREDLKTASEAAIRPNLNLYKKLSAGDTLIRDQFKRFLRQIGFHKGAYFLTSDKSNTALAQAEGLHAVYYSPPNARALFRNGKPVTPPTVRYDGEMLELSVPIGRLIYELAVEYKNIWLRTKEVEVQLRSDYVGENLMHWVDRRLGVVDQGVGKLLPVYNATSKVGLAQAAQAWSELNRDFLALPE